MDAEQLARIRTGIRVDDRTGDRIGTTGKVYAAVVAGAGACYGSWAREPPSIECWLRVDTGFLGLGQELYVPGGAVASVDDERVRLKVERDDLESFGWDRRPTGISA
jgi:hypothetical protein